MYVSSINWISDTLFQGYTNLQSLVKCLDPRDVVSDTVCSQTKVVSGCVDALKCIGMHLEGYHYSHVEMSMIVVESC